MLYVTPRDQTEVYTAHKVMQLDRGADGGLFVPFHVPTFSPEEISAMANNSLGQCVARVLNRFYSLDLTAVDVEYCVGRNPVRLAEIGRRIAVCQMWHNPGSQFDWIAEQIAKKLNVKTIDGKCPEWVKFSAKIAFIAASVVRPMKAGFTASDRPVDVAVTSGDFSMPMAVWYARKMGFPIGTVVCCCNENNTPWELLYQGYFSTGKLAVCTKLPELDVAVPESLERLIYACGGHAESTRYLEICRRGENYRPDRAVLNRLRDGMAVRVISSHRALENVKNLYQSNAYLMDPYTSLCYTGLLEYLSVTDHRRFSIVLAEKHPSCYTGLVTDTLGVSGDKAKRILE